MASQPLLLRWTRHCPSPHGHIRLPVLLQQVHLPHNSLGMSSDWPDLPAGTCAAHVAFSVASQSAAVLPEPATCFAPLLVEALGTLVGDQRILLHRIASIRIWKDFLGPVGLAPGPKLNQASNHLRVVRHMVHLSLYALDGLKSSILWCVRGKVWSLTEATL